MDLNTYNILNQIRDERIRQDLKWGQQNHPNGTTSLYEGMAKLSRQIADDFAESGELTWLDILREEFYEAISEEDTAKLRAELIQVAAVATAWIEAIDRAHAK